VLARLAEQGYLPIELLDVLRSGALPVDAGARSA
jgi:3-isopropylmalate/(R)-2-methylmalate dehydratase small subunit